jgi:hypothetical protein
MARWRSSEGGSGTFSMQCDSKHPKILGNFCIFFKSYPMLLKFYFKSLIPTKLSPPAYTFLELLSGVREQFFSSTPTLLPPNFGFLQIIPNSFQFHSQEHLDLCSYDEFTSSQDHYYQSFKNNFPTRSLSSFQNFGFCKSYTTRTRLIVKSLPSL